MDWEKLHKWQLTWTLFNDWSKNKYNEKNWKSNLNLWLTLENENISTLIDKGINSLLRIGRLIMERGRIVILVCSHWTERFQFIFDNQIRKCLNVFGISRIDSKS